MSLFISFDVETDGDTPLLNNMLSIGIVGITLTEDIVLKYQTGLVPLEGHESTEQVMNFWLSQPSAYSKVQALPKISPLEFYNQLSTELTNLSKNYKDIKFIAKPANFDWMFLKCYYELGRKQALGSDYGTSRATGYNIGFKCLDISEMFNAYKIVNNITDKKIIDDIEKELSEKQDDLAHDGLYDATCQGLMYVRLLNKMHEIAKKMK